MANEIASRDHAVLALRAFLRGPAIRVDGFDPIADVPSRVRAGVERRGAVDGLDLVLGTVVAQETGARRWRQRVKQLILTEDSVHACAAGSIEGRPAWIVITRYYRRTDEGRSRKFGWFVLVDRGRSWPPVTIRPRGPVAARVFHGGHETGDDDFDERHKVSGSVGGAQHLLTPEFRDAVADLGRAPEAIAVFDDFLVLYDNDRRRDRPRAAEMVEAAGRLMSAMAPGAVERSR